MEILILLIFVCVLLVGAAVAFFAWTVRQGTFDQADRLALLRHRRVAARASLASTNIMGTSD